MIRVAGLAKDLRLPDGRPLRILDGVDLEVERSATVAIRGRSGSGKTTLLNVLGLLDVPTGGTYELDGCETSAESETARSLRRGNQIGFVFQQFHLLEGRTAWQNVAAPLLHSRSRRDVLGRRRRAMELLAGVGLRDRASSYPSQLSGGEQQRVAIARAMARRPALLLADEPTGSLDDDTSASVLALLLELAAVHGTTLIVVTHDAHVASTMSRTLTLRDGRLHEDPA